MARFPSLIAVSTALLLLSACQSTQTTNLNPYPYLLDEPFSGFESIPIESEQDIFQLTPEAKDFVSTTLQGISNQEKRIEALVAAIFNRSDFNMLYDNSANTTASQTFANRSANCLSLSIMTYALANDAGIHVKFREIEIPEYWTRKEGYSLLNGHINLKLSAYNPAAVLNFKIRSMTVDFDPFSPKKYFPANKVDKSRVIAMFYNNKGAEALVENNHTQAYAYFREAVLTDNQFQGAWANLGILYRKTGHFDGAESVYNEALRLNNDNLTIWENLAVLHRHMGRHDNADEIIDKVESKRRNNPYYHFILGEQQFDSGDYNLALTHYRRAIRLDNSHHQFYFGMAKVHAAMGDKESALSWLKRARSNTTLEDIKERYQYKMDLFAKL